MKELFYKKVNAFTSDESFGNPASYLMVGENPLSATEMLKVGKEQKGYVSEVVFCEPSQKADIKLTYYSSECEVAFCGHGTIATMYDLISNKKEWKSKRIIKIETNKKGILSVFNDIQEENAIFITAPTPQNMQLNVSDKQIAEALGIGKTDIDTHLPIDFINAGLRTLIVPINDYGTEISMLPDECKLKRFTLEHDIDIIVVFSQANDNKFIAHTRIFAPRFGYLEDPATGTGNSAFGAYMLKNNLWNGDIATIEQGGDYFAFNPVKIKRDGDDILFGGNAKTIMKGTYYL